MATSYGITFILAEWEGLKGSGMVNTPCTVVFHHDGGKQPDKYSGTLVAWRSNKEVVITSATPNLDAAWAAATAGTFIWNDGQAALGIETFVRT